MERKIKFRAKNSKDEWVYGDLIQNGNGEFIGFLQGDEHYNVKVISMNAVDPGTVGQFTGLYDIDKREIWEGDIINDTIRNYEVVWHDGMFMLQFFSETSQRNLLTGIDLRNGSKVGTKFDNPEFLKQ